MFVHGFNLPDAFHQISDGHFGILQHVDNHWFVLLSETIVKCLLCCPFQFEVMQMFWIFVLDGHLKVNQPFIHSNLGQTPYRSVVCCISLTGGAHRTQICHTTYPMPIGCLSGYPSHSCKPNGLCHSVDLLRIARQGSRSVSHPSCLQSACPHSSLQGPKLPCSCRLHTLPRLRASQMIQPV